MRTRRSQFASPDLIKKAPKKAAKRKSRKKRVPTIMDGPTPAMEDPVMMEPGFVEEVPAAEPRGMSRLRRPRKKTTSREAPKATERVKVSHERCKRFALGAASVDRLSPKVARTLSAILGERIADLMKRLAAILADSKNVTVTVAMLREAVSTMGGTGAKLY